ncbi:MAG: urea carboxylase-associated family protein, partial [Pseudomonadota bacterium]
MGYPFETPYERKGILTPGLPVLPLGTERHPVPGGGSRAVPVKAGDEISVLDREGLQPGELVLFDAQGRAQAGYLDAPNAGAPLGLQAVLASGDATGRKALKALQTSGFDLNGAEAVTVFAEGSHAGDMATFTAQVDGLLFLAAPGGPMAPEAQDAPTELILYVKRAETPRGKPDIGPPDPLADPLEDINIQPGHAVAYEVKAGQYIQILDVKGRECSDFQAFSLRALDQGREREIDPTTTRSLMGSLYPMPGIFSKYWTVDHEPLVEIVQDTCGRHDTFGLACTARYYEDLGYPGHINCSDNMNIE